jgi:peptide/nickel transport system permease protein
MSKASGPGAASWRRLVRRKVAAAAAVILLAGVAIALVAPLLATHSPLSLAPAERLKAPGSAHWLGPDDVGRDIYSRIIYGSRISLVVGGSIVVLATLAGLVTGLLAGFYRSLDYVIMRVMDGLMAFPSIILAIALMATLGPSLLNVVLALSVVYTPRMARLVRGSVLVLRETQYVEAAQALGQAGPRILLRHILPNCVSPLIVQSTFIFASAVLGEASLSFLGVGAPPHVPSWGNILADARTYLHQAPWMTLAPGAAIMATILALNLLGDGLRDVLDPKLRGTTGPAVPVGRT